MGKVLIGNVRGPVGPQGEQGNTGDEGTRGMRGSRWVSGEAITGISTEPTVFETGIIDAMANDHYLNIKTGNVYRCYEGGDESTATWVFIGNLMGSIPMVEDSLESESKTNALSASKGKELFDLIKTDYKALEELQGDASCVGTITDDGAVEELLMYMLSKIHGEEREQIFPITHAKAVWWNKEQNLSLHDKFLGFENRVQDLEDNNVSFPKVYYGTEEPDSSIGEDGDIYIQIIEE